MNYPMASLSWDEAEINAIQRVISSGYYTMGKEVFSFEEQFAKYVGTKYAVMVNSGSSANLLMIASMIYRKTNPWKAGDEIIVPSVSWVTTYYPLCQYGLKLKFVDVDIETLNFDLTELQNAITLKTKGIIAVNLLGNPNDFARIENIVGDRDITLLEDNCESIGACLNGKQAGTFGLMGTYSTFFTKHISTMEGGVIVTDDEESYHFLICLRAHGWTRHLPKKNLVCGLKSDNDFEESFHFILPGYNFRPIEFEGAVGQEQLKKLPGFIEERKKNARHFQNIFENNPKFMIQKEIGTSSWWAFSLVVRPGVILKRAEIIKALHKKSIDCRAILAGNFVKNEVLKYFNYEIHGELKNADWVDRNGLLIGNHHYDNRKELDLLAKILT